MAATLLLHLSLAARAAGSAPECLAAGSLSGRIWGKAEPINAVSSWFRGDFTFVGGQQIARNEWACTDAPAYSSEMGGGAAPGQLAMIFLMGGLTLCWLTPSPPGESLIRYGR